jgi:PAS domain S-box-containing protein
MDDNALQTDADERLRSWYLARLRKAALQAQAGSDLTPATLVRTDRDALEKLIAEPARTSSSEPKLDAKAKFTDAAPLTFSIALVAINALLFVWILFDEPCSAALLPIARMFFLILLVLSSGAAIFLSRLLAHRKATLAALAERERAIAESTMDAFWSLGADFRFISVSPTTRRLLGYQVLDLAPMNLFALLTPPEQERVQQALNAAKSRRDAAKIETQIKNKSGALTDIELSIEYSLHEATYYCLLSDISERKQVERLKDQLTAMLSHDLRTPLTSLQFSLALLLKDNGGRLTDDGLTIVKTGQNNVERLIKLINQLLDLYSLEAKQLKLYSRSIEASVIIQNTLEAIESYAEKKNIDIRVEADELLLQADPDRLTQVLVNLVSNAIKYSPDGGDILLSVHRLPASATVEVRVTDSGPGIAEEHKNSVFDRFYQIESSSPKTASQKNEASTGLGLAICKAIIEAHGGTIDVDCTPGKGASFWFRIPAAR